MTPQSKIAVVTGAGRGIGKAIALRLAADGAQVIIASRSPDPANAVVEEIKANGGSGFAVQTDVSDYSSVQRTFEQVYTRFGRVDLLVNNAGGSARGQMSVFSESEQSTWQQVINTNLNGVLYTCRQVINPMLEQGSGCIINIASVAGMVGMPCQADYSAAKAGVIAFTQALAKEVASKGVRVNCISPGPIHSDAGREIPEALKQSLAYQEIAGATGMDRFGEPNDIASLAAFLASDDAQFITGQNYPVCGVMNLGFNSRIIK